ncbi:MAG: N-acetylmuramoyl-L-alanine amidase [Dysgonomonas sp.]|nr:N-acetylmuramoyl-L-alanine amidase [Dysgonomonas sp.]
MQRIVLLLLFLLAISCPNITAQKNKDIPREGEGIHAFLQRNKRPGTAYYNEFVRINKSKLGKNNSLLKGVAYTLPPISTSNNNKETSSNKKRTTTQTSIKDTGTKRTNKLFGKKYQNYTVKSNKLKGACFYLSSGHGGPDCGAIGKADGRQLHEDEYAYDITLRLARCLLEEGATVHMIIQDPTDGIRDEKYLKNNKKETCMGAAIPLNQLKRLKQRSDKINSLNRSSKEKYKRAVFIHLDSRSKKSQLDVFFYYGKNSRDGKKLANTMRETFRDQYKRHQPSRGFTGTVSSRNLYVLDNTSPIGIFAELGNIQNTFDQRRFLDYNNRQALAKWMCLGFIKDYENSKKRK